MDATTNTSEALVFDAKALPIVAKYMASNDIRYYICGIYVTPAPHGGVYIAGTNGHQLAVWHDPHGHCDQPRILKISRELLAAAKKKRPRFPPFDYRISYEDGRLVLARWNTCDGDVADGYVNGATALEELHIQPGKADIDGKYPDFWRVIPKDEDLVPGMHGSINAQYVKNLAETAMDVGERVLGHKRLAVAWHYSVGTNGRGAVLTRIANVPNLLIISMPFCSEERPATATPESFVRPSTF